MIFGRSPAIFCVCGLICCPHACTSAFACIPVFFQSSHQPLQCAVRGTDAVCDATFLYKKQMPTHARARTLVPVWLKQARTPLKLLCACGLTSRILIFCKWDNGSSCHLPLATCHLPGENHSRILILYARGSGQMPRVTDILDLVHNSRQDMSSCQRVWTNAQSDT